MPASVRMFAATPRPTRPGETSRHAATRYLRRIAHLPALCSSPLIGRHYRRDAPEGIYVVGVRPAAEVRPPLVRFALVPQARWWTTAELRSAGVLAEPAELLDSWTATGTGGCSDEEISPAGRRPGPRAPAGQRRNWFQAVPPRSERVRDPERATRTLAPSVLVTARRCGSWSPTRPGPCTSSRRAEHRQTWSAKPLRKEGVTGCEELKAGDLVGRMARLASLPQAATP